MNSRRRTARFVSAVCFAALLVLVSYWVSAKVTHATGHIAVVDGQIVLAGSNEWIGGKENGIQFGWRKSSWGWINGEYPWSGFSLRTSLLTIYVDARVGRRYYVRCSLLLLLATGAVCAIVVRRMSRQGSRQRPVGFDVRGPDEEQGGKGR